MAELNAKIEASQQGAMKANAELASLRSELVRIDKDRPVVLDLVCKLVPGAPRKELASVVDTFAKHPGAWATFQFFLNLLPDARSYRPRDERLRIARDEPLEPVEALIAALGDCTPHEADMLRLINLDPTGGEDDVIDWLNVCARIAKRLR